MNFSKGIVLWICSAILFSCSPAKSDIIESVHAEVELHPESQLLDLYKYFFQDYFGPGHLISDKGGSWRYLEYELANAKSYEDFDYQALLYKKQFCRVNMSVLVNGKVDKMIFMNAFFRSAESFVIPDVEIWKSEWEEIYSVIFDMNLNLKNFEKDSQHIDSVLNSGDYVVHHSENYIDTYDPHYRIIHVDELNSLNLIAK